MIGSLDIAEVASLAGDPARAAILTALFDGRARTAGELAYFAGIKGPTASGHLARLEQGNLLTVMKQGRNRYYRLANADVARMLESIMAVAALGPKRHRPRSAMPRCACPHLLRPPRRAARRGADRGADARGLSRLERRRRRSDRAGRRVPRPLRRRDRGRKARAARLLPPVPRLDRAAAASGRRGRRRNRRARLGARLDRAAARQPRPHHHGNGPRRICRNVRRDARAPRLSASRTRPRDWDSSPPDRARRSASARAGTCPSSCRDRPRDNPARRARSTSPIRE